MRFFPFNFCTFKVLHQLDTGAAEACVSSGGIMLKKEGRLGHSSHFGAAIWAEKTAKCSIAVSLSGCGEALIRTRFAERLAEHMLSWYVITN